MNTIIITGGSGAIGKGIAKELLDNNYNVILIGRNAEKLNITKKELNEATHSQNISTYCMDITQEQQVTVIMSEIWKNYNIYGLINAAGIGEPVDYLSSTEADWQDCIQGKLLGTIKVTKEASKQMITNKQNGKIIIINGTFCYDPHPEFMINSTVNAALAGFTKAASKYLGPHGICLNTINPWITDSPSWQKTATHLAKLHNTEADELNMNFKQLNPLKKFTQVKDIGQAVVFLLSEHANYINGAAINLDGGASIGF